MTQASKIRQYIISRKIGPARRSNLSTVKVTAKEIMDNVTGGTNAPNISSAAMSRKIENQAKVTASLASGVNGSTTAVFEYTL